MTTKKAFRIIVAAIIVAVTIAAVKWQRYRSQYALSAESFHTQQGWGYNILAGKTILVHQPMVPGIQGNKGFDTKQQADAAAQEMITDIKAGRTP